MDETVTKTNMFTWPLHQNVPHSFMSENIVNMLVSILNFLAEKGKCQFLIDFNGMSACLGLFYV